MRKLRFASLGNITIVIPDNEFSFIYKIVNQISTNKNEVDYLLKKGIKEFKTFKKNNSKSIVEKKQVWHIRQFLLETSISLKLKSINDRFFKEEKRIKNLSEKLILNLNKLKKKKTIDDFNLETSYSLFTKNKKCNDKYNVTEGDSFYRDNTYLLFRENTDISFYSEDWNETMNTKYNFKVCYTMHCLLFHSSIPLEDLLTTDEIWIELKVNYQFFKHLNNN